MVRNIFARYRKKSKTAKKQNGINSTRLAIDLVVLGCVVLLGVSGWLWWTRVVMNPDRVLSDTIAKNLQTKSITKHVAQSSSTGEIDQTAYLTFFAPAVSSQTSSELSQGIGSNSASVTTETIGTAEADFVRYTGVKGAENLPGADKLNGLLGTWAKREQNPGKGEQISFLNESLFGVIPFGDFNNDQRNQLVDIINQKNVYKYISVDRKIENKRPVYVYNMSINPANLVEVLREYVALSGAGDSSQLDPAQYQGLGDIKIMLTIDILSREVTKVEYSTGRIETYTGQNLYRPVNVPTDTIPVDELQRRLQGQGA